jgi:hypothetical protein
MLFLAGFAYGLRWIDHRLTTSPERALPAPARELDAPVSGQLSEALRFIFGIRTAHAAEFDASRYKAQPEKRIVTVTAPPGGTAQVELRFKNLGTAAWSPEGKGFISVYTTQPRYHAGVLRHASWLSSSQPAKLATPKVASGQTGVVTFTVQAPAKEGAYADWMQLAAEDTAWVYGGHVQVVLVVKKGATPAIAPAPAIPPPSVPGTGGTGTRVPGTGGTGSAVLLIKSAQKASARGNAAVSFTVGHKNAGAAAWSARSVTGPDGAPLLTVNEAVAPGALALTTFTFLAPKTRGEHLLRFAFAADGKDVPEAALELPVTVTDDWIEPSKPSAPASPFGIAALGGTEPTIRVGLYYTEVEREEFVADVPYEVRNLDGALLASFQAGAPVQAWYDASSDVYRLTNGVVNLSSASALRFVPLDPNGVVTALAHVDRPSWNSSINDNRFRGTIEFRRHASGRVWAINELPMEQYLWGLAESSNASPMEFHKALAVAARSYAQWHLSNPGKYDHFTVGALNDQVYKGYGMELRNPNFKAAAEATRGQVVYHDGKQVITPYFTWSDGRTRAWTDVWGGAHKPWLVSVEAPYDVGKNLYGHGVGMSAWDAIGRANAGASYDTILRHYYAGTELRKLY